MLFRSVCITHSYDSGNCLNWNPAHRVARVARTIHTNEARSRSNTKIPQHTIATDSRIIYIYFCTTLRRRRLARVLFILCVCSSLLAPSSAPVRRSAATAITQLHLAHTRTAQQIEPIWGHETSARTARTCAVHRRYRCGYIMCECVCVYCMYYGMWFAD